MNIPDTLEWIDAQVRGQQCYRIYLDGEEVDAPYVARSGPQGYVIVAAFIQAFDATNNPIGQQKMATWMNIRPSDAKPDELYSLVNPGKKSSIILARLTGKVEIRRVRDWDDDLSLDTRPVNVT